MELTKIMSLLNAGVVVPLLNSLWDTPKINENTEVSMSPLGVVVAMKL